MTTASDTATTIKSVKRGKGSKRALSALQVATRAESARLAGIVAIASAAGLPEAQCDPSNLEVVATKRDEGKVLASKTVKKLTRVKRLEVAGVLEKHEAIACQWYANTHEMAFHTTGTTANYGGAGGGSPMTSFDLLGKYAEQVDAREDYAMATKGWHPNHVLAFEGIICGDETVTGTAAELFLGVGQRQQIRKMRSLLKTLANIVHMRAGHLLPGE